MAKKVLVSKPSATLLGHEMVGVWVGIRLVLGEEQKTAGFCAVLGPGLCSMDTALKKHG